MWDLLRFLSFFYLSTYPTGVLISGGGSSSVELFNLQTLESCSLPDLPAPRAFHTSVEGVICGGYDFNTNPHTDWQDCIDIITTEGSSWSSNKYQVQTHRAQHVSWNINPGQSFMLFGGIDTETSSIVHRDGTIEPGFNLQEYYR